jgi:hypothetical protein
MRFLLFTILFLISFQAVSQSPGFLTVMPFELKFNPTTEEEVMAQDFSFHADNFRVDTDSRVLEIYKLGDDVYCYFDQLSREMAYLKICEMPANWEAHGITTGMSSQALEDTLSNLGLTFSTQHDDYCWNYEFEYQGFRYWFCVPKHNWNLAYPAYENQLRFVMVKPARQAVLPTKK